MNIKSFIVSDKQIELDLKLVPFDLWASKSHVLMLGKLKIIKKSVCLNIIKGLDQIEKDYNNGKFSISPSLGLHLTIEKCLIEKIGDYSYFMHTARSRNDQVMTAELLYLRERVLEIFSKLLKLLRLLMELAEKNILTVMPGYTHMQPAKPTTFGQWCLAYSDMLSQCLETLQHVFNKYNLSPLGSVESYGTSWPIDRLFTAKLLGFSKVWEIPQSAISSRGFIQLAYLGGLKDIAIVISKIASDLLLFNTFEYGYVDFEIQVAQQMGKVTGSSIMPQKKNPDALELLRSISPQVIGLESIVANLLSGLPMGYNRDTREVKEYMELGFEKVTQSLDILMTVVINIKLNKEKMYKAVTENYSMATDLADSIAQKTGLPYRKIYKLVGVLVREKRKQNRILSDLTTDEIISEAKSLGLIFTISDRQTNEALNPLKAVDKRKHTGGANFSVMKKMIRKRRMMLQAKRKWVRDKWQRINSAKIESNKALQRLIRQ